MGRNSVYDPRLKMNVHDTNRIYFFVILRLLLCLSLLLILTSCVPQPTPIPEFVTAEEYQVYHDLLLENPDMWNVPPGTQKMIFFDQSYVRPESSTVYSLLQNKPDVSEQLITSFLEANQKPYSFEDQFNLGTPAIFVSDASIQNLVSGLRFAEQCQHSVEAIYPRPEYGGFYYLSRVGFDANRKTALLYIEKSICGGNGGFLILKKERETWIITDSVGALNSDLGLYLADALSEEEHAVHDAVINASKEFIMGSNYQYLTVFDQTGIDDRLLLEEENLLPVISMKFSGVMEEMVNNLTVQNAEPYYLAPRFSLDVPVVLVSWQEYWQLSQDKDESDCLATLKERFPVPAFQGWLRLSRVGFNQDGDKALVYLDSYQCKSKDFLIYLEKKYGVWTLVNHVALSSLPNSHYFGRILFESNRDGNQEIYVMNADGSDPINLSNSTAIDFSPAWSPDRNFIAYNSGIDGNAEIFILDLEDKQTNNLTNFPSKDWGPDWSPDGTQIVFFTDRDSFSEIYTIQMDTFDTLRLTETDAYDRQPDWSPDGNQIAFSSDRAGNWELYLMDKNGKNITRLTNNEEFDLAPDWSPDGKMISFASKRDGNWEIYIMNLITRELKRLTNHSANDLNPTWSPDGKKIAFQSDRDGNLEIYDMNIDGSEQVNLTNNPANDYNPDW
ncbi:MAG: DPP IV N-terminal domain-containing protein [Anaerolineaceae bacterium]|nr:DPP IV N-terminal domain-containing protein [Anaerolineaceae bacterium]